MNPEDVLVTTAEVAIGLAGFSGIVAALIGDRSSVRWTPPHRFRLATLLEASLSAVVLSLIPLILLSAGVRDSTSWAAASLIWLAYMGTMIGVRAPAFLALNREHVGEFNRRMMPIVLTGLATTVALQLANVIVFRTGWPYLVVIIWGLIVGFIMFAGLLVRIWEE